MESLRRAVGTALTVPQQQFVSQHQANFEAFITSDVGKVALQQFVNDWAANVAKAKPQ